MAAQEYRFAAKQIDAPQAVLHMRKVGRVQKIITMKIAFISRSAAALRANDLANRRPPMQSSAAPLPRSIPDANRSVIYEFAMDTWLSLLLDTTVRPGSSLILDRLSTITGLLLPNP